MPRTRGASPEEVPMPTTPSDEPAIFDPLRRYVHLADGPETTIVPVTADFWQTLATRTDLRDGRLVAAYRFATPAHREQRDHHPARDQIVCLLSGALDALLNHDGRR